MKGAGGEKFLGMKNRWGMVKAVNESMKGEQMVKVWGEGKEMWSRGEVQVLEHRRQWWGCKRARSKGVVVHVKGKQKKQRVRELVGRLEGGKELVQ